MNCPVKDFSIPKVNEHCSNNLKYKEQWIFFELYRELNSFIESLHMASNHCFFLIHPFQRKSLSNQQLVISCTKCKGEYYFIVSSNIILEYFC